MNSSKKILTELKKEYGVVWTEASKSGELKKKKRIFTNEKKFDRFIERLEEKDNFITFNKWLLP